MVKLLLTSGASCTLRDQEQRTMLHLCTNNPNSKCFNLIVKALGQELEVDAVDQWGMTALHWAAHWGSVEVVKTLLSKLGARLVNIFSLPSFPPPAYPLVSRR